MFPRLAKFPRRLILTVVYMYCLLLVHRLQDSHQDSHKKEALRHSLHARAAQVKAGCASHPLPKTKLQIAARDAVNVSKNLAAYYHGLHLKAALKNVLYIPQYNLSWCLVPKVASTSWSRALLDLQGLTLDDFNDPPLQVIVRQAFRMVDPSRVNQTINTSLRFLFVRHPFQRLVSAYRNKLEDSFTLEDGAYFYKNYGRNIVERFRSNRRKAVGNTVENGGDAGNNLIDKKETATRTADKDGEEKRPEDKRLSESKGQKGEEEERRGGGEGVEKSIINMEDGETEEIRREPTFPEFVDYLLNTDIEKYDEHWKPISLQCNMCEFDFDYIIQYENFKEEIDVFVEMLQESGRLPLRFHLKWENRGGTDREAAAKYLNLVSRDKLWLLYEKYRHDFLYFGYTTDGYIEQ